MPDKLLQWRVAESIMPRLLLVNGKPMRLVLRPYKSLWCVYDISVTPPTTLATNLSSYEVAKGVAESSLEQVDAERPR